jgi:predicted lipoprotein with Yx(FWY)xxD motif
VRKALLTVAALALVAALAAGCGSSNSSSSSAEGGEYGSGGESASTGGGYGNAGSSAPASTGAAVVAVGNASKVGQVLVDSNGMTLYYFEKDQKGGSTSACSGPCASAWPPLTTSGAAKVRGGAEASLLGTIERSDGTTQVTYAGWPLYTYTGDSAPGEANGTDVKAFGASWYPLHPNGKDAGS